MIFHQLNKRVMDDEDLEQKVKRIRLTENSIKSEVKKKLDRERKKRKDQKNRSREKEKRIELKDKKGNNDNTVIHESSSISKVSTALMVTSLLKCTFIAPSN